MSNPNPKQKPKTCAITVQKNVLKKGPETEKKLTYAVIESTAELVNHCCLRGFDRNILHLMTAVPCLPSTPAPSTLCKIRTKADIH